MARSCATPLSHVAGESYERLAFFRMANDSAAAFGQIRLLGNETRRSESHIFDAVEVGNTLWPDA